MFGAKCKSTLGNPVLPHNSTITTRCWSHIEKARKAHIDRDSIVRDYHIFKLMDLLGE